jgi:rfaE bifunctional protein kinase chain/domain
MNPEQLLASFQTIHVVVVGDVMVDHYRWGTVERISPEAPVPVVTIRKSESRLGGAANVALNCRSLGAKVSLASVIGMDQDGKRLMDLLREKEIDCTLVHQSDLRKTTSKTRILSRNQQMLRFDSEMEDELNIQEEHAFIDAVLRFLQIQKPDVLIFEDYNKGVLKENIIKKIIQHCQTLGIPVAVDPKKKNFFAYQGVDIFKPNLKEVREGLHISMEPVNESALIEAHKLLKERLKHQITFITLSEQGVFYQYADDGKIVPSHQRDIADVSGAGDTVIAVAAMVYTLTKNERLMADYANIAGGLVCEEVGVVPIDKDKLLKEITQIEALKNDM